uniref:Uncharacterized protein n=1 Tax=Setaria italica TaxID=4555 RepID=K3YNU5_SETIT
MRCCNIASHFHDRLMLLFFLKLRLMLLVRLLGACGISASLKISL